MERRNLSSHAHAKGQQPWTDPTFKAFSADPGQIGLVYLLITIPIAGLLVLGYQVYHKSGHDIKIFPSERRHFMRGDYGEDMTKIWEEAENSDYVYDKKNDLDEKFMDDSQAGL